MVAAADRCITHLRCSSANSRTVRCGGDEIAAAGSHCRFPPSSATTRNTWRPWCSQLQQNEAAVQSPPTSNYFYFQLKNLRAPVLTTATPAAAVVICTNCCYLYNVRFSPITQTCLGTRSWSLEGGYSRLIFHQWRRRKFLHDISLFYMKKIISKFLKTCHITHTNLVLK